jgi:hypothetical protein
MRQGYLYEHYEKMKSLSHVLSFLKNFGDFSEAIRLIFSHNKIADYIRNQPKLLASPMTIFLSILNEYVLLLFESIT